MGCFHCFYFFDEANMKKKTIELPLLPRAKYLNVEHDEWEANEEAIRKQTMIFLQAYSDHVTNGDPAAGLHNFIYHASRVWNEEIREQVIGVCHDPWEDLDYTWSDLEDGLTKEAKAFKSLARELLKTDHQKVVPIKPKIKIKEMS